MPLDPGVKRQCELRLESRESPEKLLDCIC